MAPSGYRALAVCGTECARKVWRGETILDIPLRSFVVEIVMALRPHYFALSSIAALAGASAVVPVASPRVVLAAVIAGLGWGVGQLLNDLLDEEADRVNAPDRPIVAGRLPPGPTLLVAILLGGALVVGTVLVHPKAWLLTPAAMLLLVFYNVAKRWPLAGNVAHGALMAAAAAIGASASLPVGSDADPEDLRSFVLALAPSWRTFALVGAIAAWYLQSNYEKDRPGDRAGGYTTLAVVLPVRASALLRAATVLAIGYAALAWGALSEPVSLTTMTAGVAIGLASTLGPLRRNTDAAALAAYPAAVAASILAMIALAAPMLGRWGTTAVLAGALALVGAAFRRSSNP